MTWINASVDESGSIIAPNIEMKEIISSTIERIADEPLYIIQTSRQKACYIYFLRTVANLSPLEEKNNSIEIICKENLNHIFTSDINSLPCEPLIITEKFLQERIFETRTGYLGYDKSFFSGLTRGEFIEKKQSLETNLTFCVNQSESSPKRSSKREASNKYDIDAKLRFAL